MVPRLPGRGGGPLRPPAACTLFAAAVCVVAACSVPAAPEGAESALPSSGTREAVAPGLGGSGDLRPDGRRGGVREGGEGSRETGVHGSGEGEARQEERVTLTPAEPLDEAEPFENTARWVAGALPPDWDEVRAAAEEGFRRMEALSPAGYRLAPSERFVDAILTSPSQHLTVIQGMARVYTFDVEDGEGRLAALLLVVLVPPDGPAWSGDGSPGFFAANGLKFDYRENRLRFDVPILALTYRLRSGERPEQAAVDLQ